MSRGALWGAHNEPRMHSGAAKIAQMLRSQDPWPPPDSGMSSLDLAHQIVSQQRHLMEGGGRHTGSGSAAAFRCSQDVVKPTMTSLQVYGTPEEKVAQVAERVSVLLANLQVQCDTNRQDFGRQLEQIGNTLDSRFTRIEARLASCEEQVLATRDRRTAEASSSDASRVLRESKSVVETAMMEMQAQWRAFRTEARNEHQDTQARVKLISEQCHNYDRKMQSVESTLDGQKQSMSRLEEQLQGMLVREPPPWYGEFERALSHLERRFSEQQATTETQLMHLRFDADCAKQCSEGINSLRSQVLAEIDQKLERELAMLPLSRDPEVQVADQSRDRDAIRRLDDLDSRLAAIRVRIDSHDNRFSTIGGRAEAACQQAMEGARQLVVQHREELLSESDCQLRMLRQRVEALSELCEELMMRQTPHAFNGSVGTVPPSHAIHSSSFDFDGRPGR